MDTAETNAKEPKQKVWTNDKGISEKPREFDKPEVVQAILGVRKYVEKHGEQNHELQQIFDEIRPLLTQLELKSGVKLKNTKQIDPNGKDRDTYEALNSQLEAVPDSLKAIAEFMNGSQKSRIIELAQDIKKNRDAYAERLGVGYHKSSLLR